MEKNQFRVAIIVSGHSLKWQSCRFISKNLLEVYKRLFGTTIQVIPLKKGLQGAFQATEQILKIRPDRIFFIDHAPHPGHLIEWLTRSYESHNLPALYFHIYGDFSAYSSSWVKTERYLKYFKVKFICASQRHAKLISGFFRSSRQEVTVCPFPIDHRIFKYSPESRKKIRNKFGVGRKDFVLCYAGRISYQKNLVACINGISKFMKRTKVPCRYYIAGSFDDLGSPFLGVKISTAEMKNKFQDMISSLSPSLRSKIIYLGPMSPNELAELYSASDCFISLSTHHDEDFGMAPAEALCCGAQAILTDWGGYADFQQNNDWCQLIPVKIGSSGPLISNPAIDPALILAREKSALDRQKISRWYQSCVGRDRCVDRLRAVHREGAHEFGGFSSLLRLHADRLSKGLSLKVNKRLSAIYTQVYSNYVRSHDRNNTVFESEVPMKDHLT